MQIHLCYLDVKEGYPHLVDEVQVHVVVGAGGQGGGARHSEGDSAADKRIFCSASDLHTIGDDVHFLLCFGFHFVGRGGTAGLT